MTNPSATVEHLIRLAAPSSNASKEEAATAAHQAYRLARKHGVHPQTVAKAYRLARQTATKVAR